MKKMLAILNTQAIQTGYGKIQSSFRDAFQNVIKQCKIAQEKLQDVPKANLELGIYHLKAGNLSDAIMRFKFVVFLNPKYEQAYYLLAVSLVKNGEPAAAEQPLAKLLQMNPGHQAAQFELQKIKNPEQITEIPPAIVQQQYNREAEYYNYHMLEELNYQGHDLIVKRAMAHIEATNPQLRILDLNCNTGLGGNAFKAKKVTKFIVGTDTAENMLAEAKKLVSEGEAVYDELHHVPVQTFLQNTTATYDVVVLERITNRDVSALLSLIKAHLNKDGLVVLAVSDSKDKETVLDIKINQFSFNKAYIQAQLQKAGLKEKEIKEVELSPANRGYIVVASA